MRVLWLVRRNLTQHPGGDTVQILQTAAALRRLGVEVELRHDSGGDLHSFDLVHLFHLDRLWENIPHSRAARQAARPVVLSTIYWPPDEFDRAARAGVQGFLARLLGSAVYQDLRIFQRHLLDCREQRRLPRLSPRNFRFRRGIVELLENVAVILPNSRAEQAQIEQQLGIRRPAVIVPNAADAEVFGPPTDPTPPRDGVLCVGRIEPRKNQLALIEALRGSGVRLTLIGSAGRFNRGYCRRCRRAADANASFVETRPAEGLRAFYHTARVHACVSWYETPGLASLEAALCGCALVVTPGGCTREYFGDEAVYAQPDDPATIRAAVEKALERRASTGLAQRIAQDYTWPAAAAQTLAAYRLAQS